MMSNVDKLIASFPQEMVIPDALITWFRWLDEMGLYRNFDGEGYAHALIDPACERSCLGVEPVDTDLARLWTQTDPDPMAHLRLAPFFRLGGDGTYAALWRDDEGMSQIVVLGSGSGSTLCGVLTRDAVDFLRLIAIGYDELSFPEVFDRTPQEMFAEMEEELGEDETELPPAQPLVLRAWVELTFGVIVPERASDIVGEVADMDAIHSNDPFWQWDHAMGKWRM